MDGNSNINEIIINDENKFDYFLKKLGGRLMCVWFC